VTELLEREELLERLDAARAEGGRLVFVGGEAGVGKTSLVRAFGARVNAPVRYGSCENLTTPTPLGPFVDVSEDAAAAGEPHQVASALLERLASPHVVVLEDLPWVSRLSVPRLSLQAVSALAEPHRADAKAIYELTGGNAFYVTEVLAAGGDALPTTVRDAVLARAAGLEAPARQLLDVAALVPARAEVWLLEAVAPQEIEHLDACLASGMLRADRDSVAFRHELARLAVESAVPPQRRRTLHAAILRALASPPVGSADPSRLAHHAEEAGDAAAVLQYAPAAARRAETASAHREAFAQYARALRYAGDLERAERAELLAAYAHQAHVVGRFEESIAARGEAIELCRALGNARGEGENLARLIMPLVPVGRNAEAEEASIAAIDVLEKLPPGGELAVAYASQAYMRMLVRDNYDGVFWGGMAETLAETCGDRDTMSWALNLIGTSYVMAGETERGIEYLLRSIDIAREDGLEYRVASGYSMLGSGLGEMYELQRSEHYSRAFLDHADEHGNDPSYIVAWLACARVYRGDWDEGTALARSVLEGGHGAIGRITALIALGRVRARRGDPGVTEVLDEALELARPGGHLQRLGHVHAARAEAAWLAGNPGRALEEAQAAYPLALEKRHIWFAGELAYWQWKAGALDDAPDWIAAPYRFQLDGHPRAAADAWRAQGCPYEAARALAEADDEELLLETLAELVALGAGPAAKLVRQTLRERGATVPRGPRQTTRANPAELTSRELDVLRLVAGGLRNVDVAEQLVLSTRTVDHHVSAILRKLEVKTRAEAAAAATRLGLLE
jgi:DNA-binding CsgD family transcriptional regulator